MFDGPSGGGGSGGGFGYLILIGGAIFLKPHDIYVLSRTAGRICGTTLYAIRGLRKAVTDTMANESTSAELQGIRETMMSSFQTLENISRTVSREVSEASPVANLRRATTFKPRPKSPVSMRPSIPPERNISGMHDYKEVGAKHPGLKSLPSTPTHDTGALIIARVIEEGAFAQKQADILGTNENLISSEKP